MNFRKENNHYPSFSEFSETKVLNLKKLTSFFQDANHFLSWPSAAEDTYVYS